MDDIEYIFICWFEVHIFWWTMSFRFFFPFSLFYVFWLESNSFFIKYLFYIFEEQTKQEGEAHRGRRNLASFGLVYSLYGYNGQRWTKPNPEVQNSTLMSLVGVISLIILPLLECLPGYVNRERDQRQRSWDLKQDSVMCYGLNRLLQRISLDILECLVLNFILLFKKKFCFKIVRFLSWLSRTTWV